MLKANVLAVSVYLHIRKFARYFDSNHRWNERHSSINDSVCLCFVNDYKWLKKNTFLQFIGRALIHIGVYTCTSSHVYSMENSCKIWAFPILWVAMHQNSSDTAFKWSHLWLLRSCFGFLNRIENRATNAMKLESRHHVFRRIFQTECSTLAMENYERARNLIWTHTSSNDVQ